MKKNQLQGLLVILICLISLPATLLAQQTPPAPTRLALEVTYFPGRPPAFETVPGPDAKPSGAWFGMFGRVASWQAPPGAPPVEAVRVISRVEGDAVRVFVSTLSGSKALENEQRVATYLIRETEKITIDELRQFGIEPFGIKLVRVTPTVASVPPVVLKGVESVVVINAVANESTLPSYRITVKNTSSKNIIGIGLDVVTGDHIQITARPQGTEGQPLIASGSVHDLTLRAPIRAATTSSGNAPTTPPDQRIQIKALIFADGTYEGDAETAAAVRGYRAGEKLELSRLIPLLENALTSSSTDFTEGLKNLEAQVSSVSSDAESGLIRNLTAEFPQLDRSVSVEIKETIEFSATTIKSNLLKEIHKLQNEGSQSAEAAANRAWLLSAKERYEKWLSRL